MYHNYQLHTKKEEVDIQIKIDSNGIIQLSCGTHVLLEREEASINSIISEDCSATLIFDSSNYSSENSDDSENDEDEDENNDNACKSETIYIDITADKSGKLSNRNKKYDNVNLRVYCLRKNVRSQTLN